MKASIQPLFATPLPSVAGPSARRQWCRLPAYSMMEDADGNRVAEEKTVNLLGNPILWVTGPVTDEELARIAGK